MFNFVKIRFDASSVFCNPVGIDQDQDKIEDDQDQPETTSESPPSSSSSSDLIAYSADDLLKLRTVMMSQKWPDYLDEAFKNNRGSWDPDRWHLNKRRGSTPPVEEKKNNNEASGGDKETAANKVNYKLEFKVLLRSYSIKLHLNITFGGDLFMFSVATISVICFLR